ncbi:MULTISPECIES: phage tail protein [Lysobacter]|jgi:microcystin-dependent protein|uniref:Microcystin dependent protein n=2 Tax=Lysobacter TaxID=68 RepID=A0A0S2DFL8_LYSEN|nr:MULTISPECIES: tail fiber protein [Lysobacter]ALN57435.1 microcystin dependent protein [Lysobacter enzymogenes]QCW26042.1 phage tail protein [Lysobacter enzymogenes]QQP99387.1 phage tail protein [Lysobacter enzymogenes]UZW58835.1 tail fiber protein [Lysobacter enzymogenes]WMT02550.1 tail fiber protein [Lysobacter yananisis]
MTEVFLGQITTFGFNFAPKNFAFCNGQLLAIAQNQALFSLLGTMYGGNGTTNFALPDLRGRTPVGAGNSVDPGWNPAPYPQGQSGGVENVTLLPTQMPNHNHTLGCNTGAATSRNPNGLFLGTTDKEIYSATGGPQVALSAATIGTAGSTQPHSNVQPYLAINFCIALNGIYPSRN